MEDAFLAERDNEYATLYARVGSPPPTPPPSPGRGPQPRPHVPPVRPPTPPGNRRRWEELEDVLFERSDMGWDFDELD